MKKPDSQLTDKLKKKLAKERVLEFEPMAGHLSIRAGGAARLFIQPENEEELAFSLRLLSDEEVPYYILGNGTNVIIKDEGFPGAIICVKEGFSDLKEPGEDGAFYAGAGLSLKKTALCALEHSLTGLEWAAGIPGSLGGGVSMNAGAYGGELKDVVTFVRAMDKNGSVSEIPAKECDFSYRHSLFSNGEFVVLGAGFLLKKGKKEDIKAVMDELSKKRSASQPLDVPSCGSTFKRPEGFFAGKLIMDSGLKGKRIGGACVSEKHCGFIVNDKGASADDIIRLIDFVKETVLKKQGVSLECEVKIL